MKEDIRNGILEGCKYHIAPSTHDDDSFGVYIYYPWGAQEHQTLGAVHHIEVVEESIRQHVIEQVRKKLIRRVRSIEKERNA